MLVKQQQWWRCWRDKAISVKMLLLPAPGGEAHTAGDSTAEERPLPAGAASPLFAGASLGDQLMECLAFSEA